MKKYFGFLMIAFFLNAIQLLAQTKEQPFLTRSLQNQSVRDVKIETAGGGITVEGITSGEPRLEMYVRSNNKVNTLSKEEIQKRLDEDYSIDVNVADNKLTAVAKQKNKMFNWKNALSISFKAYVPKNVSTELHTSGGSISLSNVAGEQDFKTSGGSLRVDGVTGKIRGRTSGGSIELSNSGDDIDLATSGGSISAKNCTGKIELQTSGGSVHLNNLKGTINSRTSGGNVNGKDVTGEIDAHTSGGNIGFDNVSGSLEASTSGGNINVDMTKLDRYLTLHSSGGSVQVTVPKNQGLDINLKGGRVQTKDFTNFSGSVEDDEVKGKLNGGGAAVTVKGNGRINLAFK